MKSARLTLAATARCNWVRVTKEEGQIKETDRR